MHYLINQQIAQYRADIEASRQRIADAHRDGLAVAPHQLRIMHADVAIKALERLQTALHTQEKAEVQA